MEWPAWAQSIWGWMSDPTTVLVVAIAAIALSIITLIARACIGDR